MRYLVLGGSGFIGSHVVDTLCAAGHDVRILAVQRNIYWTPPPQVECVWADWREPKQLEQAVSGAEIVIHLVGTNSLTLSNSEPINDIADNLITTVRLLAICARNGVSKIVYSSSGGTVYGISQYLPIDENHPTQPISSYGIVKLAVEKYLHAFYHAYGLRYIILRGGNPYGIRQSPHHHQGVVSVFMYRLAHSLPIEIWGNGTNVRDYLYIEDLARAFLLASESQCDREILNVGCGQGLATIELLEEIRSVTGLSPNILYSPSRVVDVPTNVLDIGKIRARLSWRPLIELRTGLERTWAWIRNVV
jgi:UDP-glucose 4-epimerase